MTTKKSDFRELWEIFENTIPKWYLEFLYTYIDESEFEIALESLVDYLVDNNIKIGRDELNGIERLVYKCKFPRFVDRITYVKNNLILD